MKKYKIFCIYLSLILLFFAALNYGLWKGFTNALLTDVGGDLARMGYLPEHKVPRKNHTDLPILHLEKDQYQGQPVRVMTIGDSFSNGGGGGRNRYYQDYIASVNHCNVLNIEPYRDIDAFNLAIIFLNNGFLDRVRPKYLIIGASEKLSVMLMAKPMDFSKNISMGELDRMKVAGYNPTGEGSEPRIAFINQGNFKYLLNKVLYRFSDRAFTGKVIVRSLTSPFFSVQDGRTLLFYRGDTSSVPLANRVTMGALNDNFNRLADLLSKKGIRLYFLPSVDKYTLYSDYIQGNPYPRSTFFEELRKLPKRYTLIDTKEILQKELRNGVVDLYYPDDTHWSWKASEKIFSETLFP